MRPCAVKLGLDVGGTKIQAVAVDDAGAIIGRARRASTPGVAGVIDAISASIDEVIHDSSRARTEVTSVGIGIPGVVEPGTTLVRQSVNLGVDELDLGAALASVIAAPVGVENDVKAAALGAHALRGDGSMAYLNLGTGIAAGIIIDGRIWTGARGGAGEVGHLSVDPQGPLCRCGQRGCVEAFAGGAALAERWGKPGDYPVRDIFDAADAGDDRAQELRRGLAFATAAAVRALVLSADVETVVIGGGLSALGERLTDIVIAQLQAEAQASPFLRSLELGARIELLPADSPAAAIGAALIGAGNDKKGVLEHG